MCGIAGAVILGEHKNKLGVDPHLVVEHLLAAIEPRGSHASGYLSVNKDGRLDVALPVKATEAIKDKEFTLGMKSFTSACLLHTRQSTGGDPSKRCNNHPVNCGSVFLTHNGQIHNDKELKKTIRDKSWRIEEYPKEYPEVDTFALAALIDMYIESGKTLLESIEAAIILCEGYGRCAVWSEKFPYQVVIFSTDGASLDVGITIDRKVLFYASDVSHIYAALDKAYKRISGIFPVVACASLQRNSVMVNTKTGEMSIKECPKMKDRVWSNVQTYWEKNRGSSAPYGESEEWDGSDWKGRNFQLWDSDTGKWKDHSSLGDSQSKVWKDMKKHIHYVTSSHRVSKDKIDLALRLLRGKIQNAPLYTVVGNATRMFSRHFYEVTSGEAQQRTMYYWNLYAAGTVECLWNPESKTYTSPEIMTGRAYHIITTIGDMDMSVKADTKVRVIGV